MAQAPRLSVVIAAYNAEAFLEATLASVLTQECESFEVIVVDDGSTDRTPQIVESIEDDRLRYLRMDNSGGAARPRNHGVRHARGEILSFFDADDLMRPGKLAATAELMSQRPDVGLVFTDFSRINPDGVEYGGRFLSAYGYFRSLARSRITEDMWHLRREDAYDGLTRENFIGTSSVAIRRDLFDRLGGFDESLRYSEDRDLWFRCAVVSDFGFVDLPLHYYRVHPSSMSHSAGRGQALDRIRVLERQLALALPPGQRRAVRRWLAANHLIVADEARRGGRRALARTHYLLGVRHGAMWPSLRGLAWCALRGSR